MARLTEKTGTFLTRDNTRLFYRSWHPAEPNGRALIVLHRGHEHSGRLRELVADFELAGFTVFSWDSRGHGHSPGERGFAPSFMHLVEDLDSFAHFVEAKHGFAMEDTAVVAHSVGAVVASTWVHDFAPRIRALVLATPAFEIKLYIPGALPLLRLQDMLFKSAKVSSYVQPGMLTNDEEQAEAYAKDPMITKDVSAKIITQLADTAARVVADAGAIVTPTLVLSAGSDWVVRSEPQELFHERLSSSKKAFQSYPGFKHAIFHEVARAAPIKKARDFILECFEAPVDRSALLDADHEGYTASEYEANCGKAGVIKDAAFAITRAALKTLGRLSEGVKLGQERGYSSGEMLDYVYDNHARGALGVGLVIDRTYLDSAGWRGIRIRGKNIQDRILAAIEAQIEDEGEARVVDLATGAGRYVLGCFEALRGQPATATLCDRDTKALARGEANARERKLDGLTWRESDAFDADQVKAAAKGHNVGIVSGLYELFPSNEMVLGSLVALGEGLDEGAWLIYTGQPWHPDLELIARTLTHQDGSPWIMRRRTQAEMDELVRAAGFEKLAMDIDDTGIFTVSVAKKVNKPAQKTESRESRESTND